MKTIAVLNDLFFAAKLRTVATQLNVDLVIVKDEPDFIKEKESADKIIFDLNFNKFDVFDMLRKVNKDTYIIGYSDQKDLYRKAEKYCDLVLSKAEFSKRLHEMLK